MFAPATPLPAGCASACVHACLGVRFHHPAPCARLGVHIVHMKGKSRRGGEALSLLQGFSGMIVSYPPCGGVKAVFFQDIVSSGSGAACGLPARA